MLGFCDRCAIVHLVGAHDFPDEAAFHEVVGLHLLQERARTMQQIAMVPDEMAEEELMKEKTVGGLTMSTIAFSAGYVQGCRAVAARLVAMVKGETS
jgi:hypothetical protein